MNLKFFGRGTGAKRDGGRPDEGFTLVEMSIVLVIIGLIIGGILKGQEIVNDGKVKIQVAQIDAIKAGTNTFFDKFNYYPGDFSATGVLTSAAGLNGNQDGITDAASAGDTGATDGATAAADTVGSEMEIAWEQLQLANLMSGVQSSTTVSNLYTLAGKITNSYAWYGDFNWGGGALTGKMVRLQGGTTSATPILRTQDALAIDSKYDDGLPNTGAIVAASAATSNCCTSNQCGLVTDSASTYGGSGTTTGLYCILYWSLQ